MKMKSSFLIIKYFWLSLILIVVQLHVYSQDSDLYKQIKSFPEVVSIQKIDQYPFFKEAYEILIEQYLDHGNPAAGKFKQRVILSDYNKYSPVIFVTEGYRADYALKDSYINELSKILEGNQIVVEHRYFGKSMPDNINWDYLTMENACGDLHRIMKIFKRLYNNQNKWIATGISKGGTNTLAYKAYYPDDMDVWIPYVGPINFGVEDGRHEKYLTKIGTQSCRNRILEFQKNILMNRDSIQPLLDSLIEAKSYTYPISNEEVLDYCVLEYSFSFWQWGNSCADIPSDTANFHKKFEYLISVSDPDYMTFESIKPIQSFFVQAAKEMGYYGYDVKPLKPYLKIKDAKGYLSKIFLPDNVSFKFSKKTSTFIQNTIQNDGNHVMMIYGEYDPWTASSLKLDGKGKAVKIIIPKANHRTRIGNMPYAQKAEIYMLLETWLAED
jgi:hypothetical protein